MDFFEGIDTNIKQQITNAIFDGVEINMVQDRNVRSFPAYPMEWARMWAHIDANIIEYLKDTDCVFLSVKRRIWPFILIYDRSTRTLFTLLSKTRFLEVQKSWQGKTYHYLDILVCGYNGDLNGEQLTLDIPDMGSEKYDPSELRAELQKLVAEYIDEIDRNVLVCFDRQGDVVLSINAYLLASPNLSIVAQEEWTRFGKSQNGINLGPRGNPDPDSVRKSDLPMVGLKKEPRISKDN